MPTPGEYGYSYNQKDEVADVIQNYTPRGDLRFWDDAQDLVREIVSGSGATTVVTARARLASATGLARWAWERDVPMTIDAVLSQSTIDRHVASGHWSGATAEERRARLLSAGRRLGVSRSAVRPQVVRARPYTRNELIGIRNWPSTQHTATRFRNAAVAVALSLGAGVSSSEMADLLVGDIIVRDGIVHIHVDRPDGRVVPLLRNEGRSLLDSVVGAEPSDHLLVYKRPASKNLRIADRFQASAGTPVFERLRSTWIVGQLAAGMSGETVRAAAGLRANTSIERYLTFVPQSSDLPSLMADTLVGL